MLPAIVGAVAQVGALIGRAAIKGAQLGAKAVSKSAQTVAKGTAKGVKEGAKLAKKGTYMGIKGAKKGHQLAKKGNQMRSQLRQGQQAMKQQSERMQQLQRDPDEEEERGVSVMNSLAFRQAAKRKIAGTLGITQAKKSTELMRRKFAGTLRMTQAKKRAAMTRKKFAGPTGAAKSNQFAGRNFRALMGDVSTQSLSLITGAVDTGTAGASTLFTGFGYFVMLLRGTVQFVVGTWWSKGKHKYIAPLKYRGAWKVLSIVDKTPLGPPAVLLASWITVILGIMLMFSFMAIMALSLIAPLLIAGVLFGKLFSSFM